MLLKKFISYLIIILIIGHHNIEYSILTVHRIVLFVIKMRSSHIFRLVLDCVHSFV